MLPERMEQADKEEGQAMLHTYVGKRCIHVIGLDVREEEADEGDIMKHLAKACSNMVLENAYDSTATIRVFPLSLGIYQEIQRADARNDCGSSAC